MADRPVHEIRMGRVKAAIWRNDGDYGTRYNVTFSRIYKTESGWENSTSFGRDDMPLLVKVADLAHTWSYQHADRDTADSEDAESELRPPLQNGKRATAR